MDCQFCSEFTAPHGSARVITRTPEGWVLLPTVGCLTAGYCLFMPLRHLDAAADIAPHELPAVAARVEEMRELISSRYGPTILAEHGPRDCDLGASCCSHCHLHLIPVPDPDAVTAVYRTRGGPGTRLDSLEDLPAAVEGSYLHLSPRPGEHYVWPSAGFARQFVRRVCAGQWGVGDRFDWRDHPFTAELGRTYTELTDALRPAVTR